MTWQEVAEYLQRSDMIMIPLGSTEQHGPHLPLGTDTFESWEIVKRISSRTGVLATQILWVGYSRYHNGFPGTLSLKPGTMVQVVMECVEQLIQYGFRRFILFNNHGGNNIVQTMLLHQINHTTPATAVPAGLGSPFTEGETLEFFDWHGGLDETSKMLYLRPDLVHLERALPPVINFSPEMQALRQAAQDNPSLNLVWNALFTTPAETGKGGSSRELSDNGIWSLSDPRTATATAGQKSTEELIGRVVTFIQAWQQLKIPAPAASPSAENHNK